MRDYQRERSNRYYLPHDTWMRTLWLIRGYDRLCQEYEDRIEEGMSPGTEGGGGKTNKTGDPTGVKAVKLAEISREIMAIDKAKNKIPPEYMAGVWAAAIDNTPYPSDAAPRTYGYWKAKFVYEVAYNMLWI